jgi:hypothetical protein
MTMLIQIVRNMEPPNPRRSTCDGFQVFPRWLRKRTQTKFSVIDLFCRFLRLGVASTFAPLPALPPNATTA